MHAPFLNSMLTALTAAAALSGPTLSGPTLDPVGSSRALSVTAESVAAESGPAAIRRNATAAGTSLELSLHDGGTAGGPTLADATLNCAPDGGTHPRPRDACSALFAAHGRFADLAAIGGSCTMVSAPVTAEAKGTWEGAAVHFVRTYDNRCVAATASGNVFGL